MRSSLRYVSLILAVTLALGVLPMPVTAATYPSAPRNLTATEGDREVSLSWSSPSDNGGATVTGYKVFRGTSSGAGNQNIITSGGCASPTSRSCTDSGLTNGQRYYYIVSAVNSAGQGPPSNEADARPEAEVSATLPSAPRSLSATAGTGEVSLTWSRPSDDGGATIESYRVFRGTSSGAGNQNIITSGGCASPTSRSCTDSGLANGKRYYYIVSAVNSEGQGAPSNEASATTTGTAPPSTTYPDAPTGLSASPGNGQVSLTWSAPSNNGGASITNYKVFRGTTGGLGNQNIVTSGGCANLGSGLSCTDTGLSSGQAYYYRVSAVNSVGQGPTSNEATATTIGTPPQAATYPDPPTGLAAFGGNSQVGLGWNAPSSNGGSVVTNYKVFRGTTSGLGNQNLVTSGGCANLGTQLSCTDTGLNSGQTYYYRVSAVNNVGQGPTSNEATATTTGTAPPSTTYPDAPTGLSASAGNGQASLTWSAPGNNGGSGITNYKVFRGTTSGLGNQVIVTNGGCANLGNVLSCTDTGLNSGQAYYYRVSAVNSIGQGPTSNEATATTTGAPAPSATLPGAPRNLDAYGDAGQNYLGWNAPSSNGGSSITSYRVFRGTSSGSHSIVTTGGCANLGVTLACTDTGLVNGQAYYYVVSAVNSVGQGAPSNQISATTTGTPQDVAPQQLPDLVVHPISINPNPPVTGQSVAVTCSYSNSPNAASTQTGFSVQVSIDGGTPKTTTSGPLLPGQSDARTFTFTEAYSTGSHAVVCEVNKDRAVAESNHLDSGTTVRMDWVDDAGPVEPEPTDPVLPPVVVEGGPAPIKAGDAQNSPSTFRWQTFQVFYIDYEGQQIAVQPIERSDGLAKRTWLFSYNPNIDIRNHVTDGPLQEVITDGPLLMRLTKIAYVYENFFAPGAPYAGEFERFVSDLKRGANRDYWAGLAVDVVSDVATFTGGCITGIAGGPLGCIAFGGVYIGIDRAGDLASDLLVDSAYDKATGNLDPEVAAQYSEHTAHRWREEAISRGEHGIDMLGRRSSIDEEYLGIWENYVDARSLSAASERLRNPNDQALASSTQVFTSATGLLVDATGAGGPVYGPVLGVGFGLAMKGVETAVKVDQALGNVPYFLDALVLQQSVEDGFERPIIDAFKEGALAVVSLSSEYPATVPPYVVDLSGVLARSAQAKPLGTTSGTGWSAGYTDGSKNVNIDFRSTDFVVKVKSKVHDGDTLKFVIYEAAAQSLLARGAQVTAVNSAGERILAEQAFSLEDVLNPFDDEDRIEYFVNPGESGYELYISFPHFSEWSVEIAAMPAVEDFGQAFVTPIGILAMAAAAVVLVAGAYGLGRRRARRVALVPPEPSVASNDEPAILAVEAPLAPPDAAWTLEPDDPPAETVDAVEARTTRRKKLAAKGHSAKSVKAHAPVDSLPPPDSPTITCPSCAATVPLVMGENPVCPGCGFTV